MFGLVIVVLLAVILGAFAAVAFVASKEIDEVFTPKSRQMKESVRHLEAPLPGKPTNILVLGSDYRNGDDANNRRSDTMLVVRLDPKGDTISMLSIPRDLYVDIPGHGQAKINDAYSLGGPALSIDTIKELTGLDVNFVMNVDFKGFRGLVDTIGGVWVDVDHHYFNEHDGSAAHNYAEIDIDPGYQLLDGRDALAFARYRHGDTDFHRIARQQQTLAAIKQQVSGEVSITNPGEILGLFNVMKKNVEIAGGGNATGVDKDIILDYMRLALKLEGRDVYQVEVKGELGMVGEASVVLVNESTINGAVDAFLHPSKEAQSKTADQVTGQQITGRVEPGEGTTPAEPKVPAPAETTVTVMNGSGEDGAANSMHEQLLGIGYQSVLPAEAMATQSPNLANTVVQYRRPAGKVAAEALAARIEGASAESNDSQNTFDTQLLVVVGKVGTSAAGDDGETPDQSDELKTDYESNVVPERGEARVTTDPEYGRDEFAALGSVGMPVLYPTVRESSSTYDEPIAYRVRNGKSRYGAYRIVAETSEGYYWGLQGISWPDPPILDSPTRTLKKGKRNYKLFFNGTKLHRVSWRQGSGTYWISNTVLDELNNETMLAIAEGVKPL